jgi:hypothetical protein
MLVNWFLYGNLGVLLDFLFYTILDVFYIFIFYIKLFNLLGFLFFGLGIGIFYFGSWIFQQICLLKLYFNIDNLLEEVKWLA